MCINVVPAHIFEPLNFTVVFFKHLFPTKQADSRKTELLNEAGYQQVGVLCPTNLLPPQQYSSMAYLL